MALLEDVLAAVQHLKRQVEELPARLVHARQVIVGEGLSDISERLGLMRAGEFRAGNNLEPGEGFSGVRIGFPGFFYPSTSTADSDHYNIAGVDADTLQFGMRSSDGIGIFGGGNVELSAAGMTVGNNETGFIQFRNVSGLAGSDGAFIALGASNRLVFRNQEIDTGGFEFIIVDSDQGTPQLQFIYEGVATLRSRLILTDGPGGAELIAGSGAAFWGVANSDSAGYLDLKDGGSTLVAPSDAYGRLYTRDGNLRFISTDGVDYQLNTT